MMNYSIKANIKVAVLSATLLLAGCSAIFPKPALYVTPHNTPDVAKIRLMGAPMSYALYQKDSAGKETGGWVQEHSAYVNILLGNTQDLGFPKLKHKDYSDTFFETTLLPDRETTIHHSLYDGCTVDLTITPKKNALYEIHYSYGDKTGYCVIYAKEIKYDPDMGIYYEDNVK
ncbi:hypothetical protein [Cronobacter dublinensis]|uniref:hypothetical protein n=1 Tax=Cronobacter dublinensis TaxID=413497 RepID=UPI0024AC8D26|nr:hypothetical protein [Cronobacter dublinensis]MDI6442608.1 hypothetical protein [Cronobacter dublinensis]